MIGDVPEPEVGVGKSPLEVPEPFDDDISMVRVTELDLKRLERCMTKPWDRLAMIEHQKVEG